MVTRIREINVSTLVGSMNRYLTAYSRWQMAQEAGWRDGALDYVWNDLRAAHRQMLEDGHATLDDQGVVHVTLPARGRVGNMLDIPRYKRFIGYDQRDPMLVYRFEGMNGSKENWLGVDPQEIPLYEHQVVLNEDFEGYCLLYEDLVMEYELS
jgi:hypothetical protein